jgi:hypothetical protein
MPSWLATKTAAMSAVPELEMGKTAEEMQTLTTVDGEEVTFKPSTVICVTSGASEKHR